MANIQELKNFNNACDEFVLGKYILVDLKITSILKIIAEDEKIANIVNTCLSSTDFNALCRQCLINTDGEYSIIMPNDEISIVSFVYNLLYRFKSGELDLYKFLKKYYNQDTVGSKEYTQFAQTAILPFKDAINSIYAKRHIIVESDDFQINYYNRLMSTIKLVAKNVDAYKLNINDREEFTMLLNALYIASEKNDKKLVFSLMIGLDYFTRVHKKSRIAYLTLEECFE